MILCDCIMHLMQEVYRKRVPEKRISEIGEGSDSVLNNGPALAPIAGLPVNEVSHMIEIEREKC